jgi:hypothetical protein
MMPTPSKRFILHGILTFAVLPFLLAAYSAHAQDNGGGGGPPSHVLMLPNPTPRERPLDQVYSPDQEQPSKSDQVASERNAKRRELEVWAADELVTLSENLKSELAQPKTAASMTTAATNAEKIEQLAKSLATAMKAK